MTNFMMSRGIVQAEFHENTSPHGAEGSARSIQSLDTAILMAEMDYWPKSQMTSQTWRSEATADTGLLLHDPETFVSGGYSHRKSGTDRSDVSKLDSRMPSSTCFNMGDFVNSSGNTASGDLSPRTNASLDTNVLLCDSDEKLDYRIETGHYRLDSNQSFSDGSNEFDEDYSSVYPLDDLVSARTVASLTTEVLLKPTEELAQVIGSHKAQKAGRPKEMHHVMPSYQGTSRLAEFELSSTPAKILDTKPNHGRKSEISSTQSDKPAASQSLKAKPPASESFSKNFNTPSSQISSQGCFSDLAFVDHDETGSESASTLVSNVDDMDRGGIRNNVEHTRMHSAYTHWFAQHDNGITQSDRRRQRIKVNQIQRSKSASRSRSGITSLSSLVDSPRSVETSVSLGQRIVRKSQENGKKIRQSTAAERKALSQSFMHDDESSCVSSQKSTPVFHEQIGKGSVKKKARNHTLSRVQEDSLDGALGLTVKGSPVQSRPQSSSSSLQETVTNEWIRRKKYNPRQSLQTEALWKKTGRHEGKPAQSNGRPTVEESELGQQNRRNCATSSTKNAPCTSSDWTDDEEQQLIPCGRDLSAVCQMSARVKRLSDQVLHILRRQPEFKVNEMILINSRQTSLDTVSLEDTLPEFLHIIHNLETAERQMSAVFEALSSAT